MGRRGNSWNSVTLHLSFHVLDPEKEASWIQWLELSLSKQIKLMEHSVWLCMCVFPSQCHVMNDTGSYKKDEANAKQSVM